MKLLYISRDVGEESNGANKVMLRNRDCLRQLFGHENVIEYNLPKVSIKNAIYSILSNNGYGITPKTQKEIVRIANSFKPDIVFIDSTSYGSVCKALAKYKYKIVCFAHNVDTELCKQEFRTTKSIKGFLKYHNTKKNEASSLEISHKLICLTSRDSDGFLSLFGRSADLLLPITFNQRDLSIYQEIKQNQNETFAFFGSDFFPNVEGIVWFIKNVAPHVDAEFRIIGKCCENHELKKLPIPRNVTLVGYANSIESEYYNASGIIAPIFKGSGMKTKTIEALSYGKSIFGTGEAFAGIECDYSKVGALCNSEMEFINALNSYNGCPYNRYSEKLFIENFSTGSNINKLKQLLSDDK